MRDVLKSFPVLVGFGVLFAVGCVSQPRESPTTPLGAMTQDGLRTLRLTRASTGPGLFAPSLCKRLQEGSEMVIVCALPSNYPHEAPIRQCLGRVVLKVGALPSGVGLEDLLSRSSVDFEAVTLNLRGRSADAVLYALKGQGEASFAPLEQRGLAFVVKGGADRGVVLSCQMYAFAFRTEVCLDYIASLQRADLSALSPSLRALSPPFYDGSQKRADGSFFSRIRAAAY